MVKIEFNCPNCGKEKIENLDVHCVIYFTSCSCGTYFSIFNNFGDVRVEEIEREEFYNMLDVMSKRSDSND